MAQTLPPGTILQNQYRIIRVLGVGGMGAVYLAEDTQLFGKHWAVKELIDSFSNPQERAAAWQQFEQEARILVSLDHPNLPKIVRYFSEGGRLYLVMEYIDGRTLEEILAQTPGFLPEAQVVDWARQICDVLDYLHSRMPPVIFRDLKPANIMLGRDNRIRLIDFGIARLFDPRKQTDTLKMGSHGYAPPEQYAGMGRTDARSDVYGLGATMYHLLTNQVPVDSIQRILPQPMQLIPPRRLNPSLSPGVEQVILMATNEHPDRRYQSATQMKAAISGQAAVVNPPATVRCSRCGAVNRSTARFCSSCGQTMSLVPPRPVAPPPAFQSAPPPPPPRPVAPPPVQNQPRRRPPRVGLSAILIVALACVVVIILFKGGVISWPVPTATGVVAGMTPGLTLTVPAAGSTVTPGSGPSTTPLPGVTARRPPASQRRRWIQEISPACGFLVKARPRVVSAWISSMRMDRPRVAHGPAFTARRWMSAATR
jgi:serine/threonine protein kinase